ncbi:MAG: hypothetical protein ACYTKD_09670 [Planctomycetota bacterium]
MTQSAATALGLGRGSARNPSGPDATGPGGTSFRKAAGIVRRRVLLARWLGLLGRTAVPLFATGLAVFAGLRVYGVRVSAAEPDLAETVIGAGAVLVWAVAAAFIASRRRPGGTGALAFWDERAGRNEMFVSAACFERSDAMVATTATTAMTPFERLHVARARAALGAELGSLARVFPVRVPPRALIAPAAFLAFLASGAFRMPTPLEDLPLTDDARRRAREVAAAMEEKEALLAPLASLDDDERKELEQIRKSLEDAAAKMKELDAATPREVLEDLERRAREAERLAEKLKGDEGGLSEAFIAELARHADTAPLAEGLRARDSERIATEAEKLQKRLDARPEMSIEERRRIEDALAKALGKATRPDMKTVVGKGSSRAHDALRRDRLREAADEFEKIAEHYRRATERARARRQLSRLADSLRRSGNRIFGRSSAGMRRLAMRRYGAQGRRGAGQLMPLGTPRPGSLRSLGNLPLGTGRPGQPRGARFGTPMPGSGMCPVPGTGMPGGACPGGMPGAGQTPIPGTGACSGGGMGQGAGQGAGQGLGAGGAGAQGAGDGGHEAGHGSAGYGSSATTPLGARRTGVVAASPGMGESDVRMVEGESHSEESARRLREIAIEFVKAEEEALDEEPLPLSRREQVLRYFTGLRRQIEDDE